MTITTEKNAVSMQLTTAKNIAVSLAEELTRAIAA